MPNVTLTVLDTPGLTLYAYPTSQALANWNTHRVLLTETTGKYVGTVNTDNGDTWAVFSGAAQPASYNLARWTQQYGAEALGTNAPANWINAASVAAAALNDKGNWNIGKTGYSLTTPPLDAAGTRSALGLAIANLDTQLSGKPTLAQIEASTVLAKEATVSSGFSTTNNLITALNNLSAKMNIFGAPLLEIPDSGTTVYAFTVVVKDDEDKLVNLDGSPTIAAANAAGTSRSANLSVVSNPSTGRYTFTYSVANTHAKESLRITVSGTVSAEARYIEWIGAVVDYDTLTTLQDVQTKVTNIQTRIPAALNGGRMDSYVGAYGTGLTPLMPVVEGRKVSITSANEVAAVTYCEEVGFATTVDTVNDANVGRWLGNVVSVDSDNNPVVSVRNYYDTGIAMWMSISGRFQTMVTNTQTLINYFGSMTRLDKWLAAIMGKTADAPTLAEINTVGAATSYNNTTDSLQAQRDTISDTILDTVIENGLTLRQCIRIANSVLAGSATGMNSTPVFKSLDGTKNRVVGTISGENRTITSVDAS